MAHRLIRLLVAIADPRDLIAWLLKCPLRHGSRGEALSRLRRARSDLAVETLDGRRETYIQHPALEVVDPRVANLRWILGGSVEQPQRMLDRPETDKEKNRGAGTIELT